MQNIRHNLAVLKCVLTFKSRMFRQVRTTYGTFKEGDVNNQCTECSCAYYICAGPFVAVCHVANDKQGNDSVSCVSFGRPPVI